MTKILVVSLIAIAMLLSGCIGYSEPEVPYTPVPETPVPEQPVEVIDQTEVVLPDEPPVDRTWVSPGKVNISNFYPGARAEYPITIHNGNDIDTSFAVLYRYPDHVAEKYSKSSKQVQNWIIIADSTPILMPFETRDVLVALAMPEDAQQWSIPLWNLTQLGKETKVDLASEWQEACQKATTNDEELPPKPELLQFLEDIYEDVADQSKIISKYQKYIIPTDRDKWEFWISIMDTSQVGTVKTELCIRWLVDMR